jgi:phosphoglycolate phosphatase-like HAD superfamily hydrolase
MNCAPSRTIATIYLDFDGTIVDPSQRLYQLYSEEVRRLGGRPLTKTHYWALKRRRQPEPAIIHRTVPSTDLADYLARREERIEHPDLLRCDTVLPRVRAALQQLAVSYRLVLVSRRRQEAALHDQVRWLGLAGYFAHVTACYQLGVPGWQSKVFAIRADARGDANPAMVVGDTEDDIEAGSALSLATVAVLTGLRTRAFLTALAPHAVLPALTHLPVWLMQHAHVAGPPARETRLVMTTEDR